MNIARFHRYRHMTSPDARKTSLRAPLTLFERIVVKGLALISSRWVSGEQNRKPSIEEVAASI